MSSLPFQVINLVTDLFIVLFVGFYLLRLRRREKNLEKKETKVDQDYHHVVDSALARERQILSDATQEADQIITGAKYISETSRKSVDEALKQMVVDIQKEATDTARNFTDSYQSSLKQLATQSLGDFENVAKELEEDLKKQIKVFHDTLLPNLEKELEDYKQARIKEVELTINSVVQKVSQEVLNKSLSLEDHQKLILESMERAKREGIFG